MSRVQVPSVTPVLGPGFPFIRRLGLDYSLFASFGFNATSSINSQHSFKQVYALLAQLAEQRTLNPQVLGSIPRERTTKHQVRRVASPKTPLTCLELSPSARQAFSRYGLRDERVGKFSLALQFRSEELVVCLGDTLFEWRKRSPLWSCSFEVQWQRCDSAPPDVGTVLWSNRWQREDLRRAMLGQLASECMAMTIDSASWYSAAFRWQCLR